MSRMQLDYAAAELRRRYIAHEISPDQFASLSEDIRLCERRAS